MYSDSDHAGEAYTGDSRSHTGVMILLNGMPIHWRSNKQPKTSLSSAEAEIYAMSTAVKDARTRLWIAEELKLKVEWPLILHVDNAAGESLQHSTCGSTKLKRVFGLHQDWVQELKNEDIVNAVHIDTDTNLVSRWVYNPLRGRIWIIKQLIATLSRSIGIGQPSTCS